VRSIREEDGVDAVGDPRLLEDGADRRASNEPGARKAPE
jgi:hypothetical protein